MEQPLKAKPAQTIKSDGLQGSRQKDDHTLAQRDLIQSESESDKQNTEKEGSVQVPDDPVVDVGAALLSPPRHQPGDHKVNDLCCQQREDHKDGGVDVAIVSKELEKSVEENLAVVCHGCWLPRGSEARIPQAQGALIWPGWLVSGFPSSRLATGPASRTSATRLGMAMTPLSRSAQAQIARAPAAPPPRMARQ